MVRKKGIFSLAFVIGVVTVAAAVQAGEEAVPTQTYSIGIQGMTCESCAVHVQKLLADVPGVVKAAVDYQGGHAWVTAKLPPRHAGAPEPRSIAPQLAAAVKQTGYQPTLNYLLTIQGMTCESCSKHIEQTLAKVPGVSAASVNYKGAYAVVSPSAKAGDLSQGLVAAVQQAGYKAAVHTGP